MSLDRLTQFAVSIVILFAIAGQLPRLTTWVYKAEAHLLWDARTDNWGSPHFFNTGVTTRPTNLKQHSIGGTHGRL